MKNVILKILVVFLKILYLPMKPLKVKNKITYISRQSNNESIDFKSIREEIEKKYPEISYIVLSKKLEAKDGIIKQLFPNILNIFKQMYHLATSKVIILDTYCITACVLPHKKETKVIQIWHALGAVKKFGYQTIGAKYGASEKIARIMCMHKNYDYVLAPSKVTAGLYKKAFNVEEDRIKYLGMPRIDYILNIDDEKKQEIFNKYPILEQKQNILYVPTYRKGERVELDELVEKMNLNKYNLIIKLHPLDLKDYTYIEKTGVIYENKFKTYDLLKVANKVITDYSSLSIEASLLNIPVYFYTYDIKKYAQENGINFDFEKEPIGIYNSQNIDKLLKLLEENYDYEILNQFKNKYVSINTNQCTKQIVEFIARLVKNEEIESIGNEPSQEKSVV